MNFLRKIGIFFSLKTKSRNRLFYKIYFKNFFLGSRALTIWAFLTPHGSQIATTVAILSPAPPQGGSYSLKLCQACRNS
jgi:hypothetical protein